MRRSAIIFVLFVAFGWGFGFKAKLLELDGSNFRRSLKNLKADVKRSVMPLAKAGVIGIALLGSSPMISNAVVNQQRPNPVSFAADSDDSEFSDVESESLLTDTRFRRAEFNAPSDDFWYPPFMIGRWTADYSFKGASFSDKVDLDKLLQKGALPGIEKYSIFALPNTGEDVQQAEMRFVQLDSHPREDHPANVRSLVQTATEGSTTVDSAPYAFQKAPDWFHSPANHWKIQYHDDSGQGEVRLDTLSRHIETFAGTVETTEVIRQTHDRTEAGKFPSRRVSDYAFNWKFSVPGSSRDEFVTVDDLRKANTLDARLNVLAYVQPTNDIYRKFGPLPAGVYKYDVKLQRKNSDNPKQETAISAYPFVWRDAGPVELDKYFGY